MHHADRTALDYPARSLFRRQHSWAIHAEGGEPPYFAITNARVFPVSGPVIENGTVVVAKGLIQAVGADAKIPPEAWVIDGKGMSVYPGLIDAGTDLGLQKAEESHGAAHSDADRAHPAMGPEDRPLHHLTVANCRRRIEALTTSASPIWRATPALLPPWHFPPEEFFQGRGA